MPDTGVWIDFFFIAVLIGLNGALAGSEMAFVALRDGQLRRLGSGHRRAQQVASLGRDPRQYLAATQLGITATGFLASAVATVSLKETATNWFAWLGPLAEPAGVAFVTIGLTSISLVFGELVPKRLAMQRPEKWSLRAAAPLLGFIWCTRPLVSALGWATDRAVQLAGGDPEAHRSKLTSEDLLDLIKTQPSLTHDQRQIVASGIEIATRSVHEIVVPRSEVVSVDVRLTTEEALVILQEAGFSRAPVVDQNLDHVVGQVHLHDLVNRPGRLDEALRPILTVPGSTSVLEALLSLREQRTKLAIVSSEEGGCQGIVTMEDIVEEVVGEIYDEIDRES